MSAPHVAGVLSAVQLLAGCEAGLQLVLLLGSAGGTLYRSCAFLKDINPSDVSLQTQVILRPFLNLTVLVSGTFWGKWSDFSV